MIACSIPDRVMASIGVEKCGSAVVERAGSGGWRDKRAAGCGGCEVQKSLDSSAIRYLNLLALNRNSPAILSIFEPSPLIRTMSR